MSSINKTHTPITASDYLLQESSSEIKHELIDGDIYAMAGASANHERIAGNIYAEFRQHLKNNPCEPFSSNMKVQIRDNFYYPDVLVDCHFDESQLYYTQTPILIVEVISKSTRKMDEQFKRLAYLNIPTLQEYVIIEQDFVDIAVYRKSEQWHHTNYFLGDNVTFESVDLTLSVEEIYQRVKNEDMQEWAIKE